ncbi:MAG: hypothetical protein KIS66_01450 [Fimbriimonadaceae bacterium]|nr:hypothetical protein [Fimbriimonadaceae bacterium]
MASPSAAHTISASGMGLCYCLGFEPQPDAERDRSYPCAMRYLAFGLGRLFTDHRLWPFAVGPLIRAAGLYAVAFVVGLLVVAPLVSTLLAGWGVAQGWGLLIGGLAFGLIWVLASGMIFVTLCFFFSSLLWDRLSEETERSLGHTPARCPLSRGRQRLDLVARIVVGFTMGLFGTLFGWAFAGALAVAVAGTMALLDTTSSALSRRGLTLGPQFRRVCRLPGALGFATGVGLLSLVPFLNLLLLPAFVIGGTRMVLDGERGESL